MKLGELKSVNFAYGLFINYFLILVDQELEELKTTMNELNTKNASMKSELEVTFFFFFDK